MVFIGYKPTTIWEYDGDLMIDLGKFDHDLTVLPSPGMMGIVAETMGNHPQMAELFRLVNYYNLPRLIWL